MFLSVGFEVLTFVTNVWRQYLKILWESLNIIVSNIFEFNVAEVLLSWRGRQSVATIICEGGERYSSIRSKSEQGKTSKNLLNFYQNEVLIKFLGKKIFHQRLCCLCHFMKQHYWINLNLLFLLAFWFFCVALYYHTCIRCYTTMKRETHCMKLFVNSLDLLWDPIS